MFNIFQAFLDCFIIAKKKKKKSDYKTILLVDLSFTSWRQHTVLHRTPQ